MRVVHVFSAPQSPYFFLEGQIDYLTAKGAEIHVVMPQDSLFSSLFKEREHNARVHHLPIERKISLFSDLKSLFGLIRLFKKINPDIIHLHTPKASFLGAIAGRICRHKHIIFQMHGLVSANGNATKKGVVYYMEKITCSLAHKVFAVSFSLKDFAIQYGYCSRDKIGVIHNGSINGINTAEKFNMDLVERDKYLADSVIKDRFVVGFIGRIVPDKGIDDYLQVLSRIKHKGSFFGVIVGDNESEDFLSEKIEEYNLLTGDNGDLVITGMVLDPQNIMARFDLLLFPTKREGFGLVAAEANALGMPVVGYDIPGVKDAVQNQKTGILVKFDDTDALEEAVVSYYKNKDLLLEHGLNGRKRVMEIYNSEDIWKGIFKVYQACLNS